MSIVRDNLMTRQGYAPYCGNSQCYQMPRTYFNGKQFVCPVCGWVSGFEPEFIQAYKEHWGK